ncbi:MAG: hypothetical protein HYS08_03125 [Chlamydiae bacterium]|nr:hypothetical protein [Chlamydiota bacterium]
MLEANLLLVFARRLNTLDVPYMVTGSMASIIYGEPRLTHDVDVVIELWKGKLGDLNKVFPGNEFYCPPTDVIACELAREMRGHFNIIHHETGFKADIYLVGSDELSRWGISCRKKFDVEGEFVWIAPPEYVITRKLEYYREGKSGKHLRDIRSMLDLSSDEINFPQLEKLIENADLREEWQDARRFRA